MRDVILTIKSGKRTPELLRLLNAHSGGDVELTQEVRDVISFKVPIHIRWDVVCKEEGMQFVSVMSADGEEMEYRKHGLFKKS